MDARRITAGDGAQDRFRLPGLAHRQIWPDCRTPRPAAVWAALLAGSAGALPSSPPGTSGTCWLKRSRSCSRMAPGRLLGLGLRVTMSRFENADGPIRLLRRFVQAVATSAGRPQLADVLPALAEEAAEEVAALAVARTYRRLIIRILERRTSSAATERGRRYVMQVHTAMCEPRDGGCCGRGYAPAAARGLHTVKARTLDEESKSG